MAEMTICPPVWVIDLDGVIWRGDVPIPGSVDAIARLQQADLTVIFATNNSAATAADFEAKLARHGIDSGGNVVTSAQATAALIKENERVFVVGEKGVREAVTEAGGVIVNDLVRPDDSNDSSPVGSSPVDGSPVAGPPVDTVVVGLDRSFNYHTLRLATRAVLAGARLVASNADVSYPAADGIDPGNGSLLAAIETASGRRAEVAGKPHAPMADLVRSRWGGAGVCVGDRPETDGEFARTLGYDFALVFSGVTQPDDLPVEPQPVATAADLSELVHAALAAGPDGGHPGGQTEQGQ